METFPCKEPNCDQVVQFNGVIKIPANLSFTKSMGNSTLSLSFKPIRDQQEDIKGSVVIEPNNVRDAKKEVFFPLEAMQQDVTENFYLTCPLGHIHSYSISIKNG